MSSILTALKKLENSEDRKKELLVLSGRGFSRQRRSRWNVKEGFRFSLKILLVASLVMFSIGLALRWKHREDAKTITASVLPEEIKPAASEPDPETRENSPPVSNPKPRGPLESDLPRAVSQPGMTQASRASEAERPGPAIETGPGLAENPGWTLQAIAWAPDPKKRIAVINGSVLKEGDSFQGAFISKIGQNDVVLLKEDDVLRLIFR